MQMHLGWHFCQMRSNGVPVLRDGTEITIGSTYEHAGPLSMCKSGYHDSARPIDALKYAPGSYLCRTLASRDLVDADKHVSRFRIALAGFDATNVLHLFAARIAYCALLAEREAGREPMQESWDAVAAKVCWCRGEITSIELNAAESAAESAAWSAARSAACSAAWSAARSAACSAAWSAARSAAWSAADGLLLSMLPIELRNPSLLEPR